MVRGLIRLADELRLGEIKSILKEKQHVHCVGCGGFGHRMRKCASTKHIRTIMKTKYAGKRLRHEWNAIRRRADEEWGTRQPGTIFYPQTAESYSGAFRPGLSWALMARYTDSEAAETNTAAGAGDILTVPRPLSAAGLAARLQRLQPRAPPPPVQHQQPPPHQNANVAMNVNG